MKIDVHADDYALSMNTSRDIIKLIEQDKFDSVSILPNMVCFREALALWQQQQQKQEMPLISIHLNFVEGHCCAAEDKVSYLIDENGYLAKSWGELFRFNYTVGKRRREIKQQFKTEIKAQMDKIIEGYRIEGGFRIDSHQHTHMIPIVFEALCEVIEEEKYSVSYIRDAHDLFSPYLRKFSLWRTYRPINMVKVLLLNLYSVQNRKRLNSICGTPMYLSGVFLSGKMNGSRLEQIVPLLLRKCERTQHDLELLFHPGTLMPEETGSEFINPDAVVFYQSSNRNIEWKSLMQYAYWGGRKSK